MALNVETSKNLVLSIVINFQTYERKCECVRGCEVVGISFSCVAKSVCDVQGTAYASIGYDSELADKRKSLKKALYPYYYIFYSCYLGGK